CAAPAAAPVALLSSPTRRSSDLLDIAMWIERLRAVDFTVGYEVRAAAAAPDSPPAVVASTQIAAFDIKTQRLRRIAPAERDYLRSEEHTSELQSREKLVCRLLLA